MNIDDLESRLMVYLEDRAKNAKVSSKPTKPVSASWLSILFAVLAVGSQYHDSPYHIRTKDAQKYMLISFHFLMVGNFLLRSDASPPAWTLDREASHLVSPLQTDRVPVRISTRSKLFS